MVKWFAAYFYAFFLTISFLEAAPWVDSSIDSSSQAHFPIQGTITITHGKEETIDPHSFTMEDKPLDVSFVKDVAMTASSDTLVTIYHFQLPAKEKGMYVLPAISVKIEGHSFSSAPSSYEVQDEGAAAQPAAASPTTPSGPLVFRLEASVHGPTTLYPGERTKLVYRISYNRSIDLTRSEFPMIHPSHFQKIGDVHIKDSQLPDVTVQDLTQEVEASELGTFSFGPSFIEGYAYTIEAGQKIYDSKLLRSEAPLVTLEVKPFPQPTQPASFTGALGQIQVESVLTSSNTLLVGDTLQLQVKIQGITNLTELNLPRLQCQPGFSGFFQTSNLPPLAEVKDKIKVFYVELRPSTSLVEQIPSIEVSSFDLAAKKYIVQHSAPIPITVTAHTEESTSLSSIPLFVQFQSGQWPTPPLPPLELKEDQVGQKFQMRNSWLKSDRVLWLIPFGILLLILQAAWKRHRERFPKPQPPKSEKLFKEAFKNENLQLLEQAFWNRLWEKRKVPEGFKHPEILPAEGQLAPVRSFIFQLQAWQYGTDKNSDVRQMKQQAQHLFDII